MAEGAASRHLKVRGSLFAVLSLPLTVGPARYGARL
jgi:hypothetical protein